MPTCTIIGCTSGYRSNPEKVHMFSLPRDPESRKLWVTAIKRTQIGIKQQVWVCEKHFRCQEILWERKLLAPNGTLLGVSQYKVPRLQKGSVPSIFPWSEIIIPQNNMPKASCEPNGLLEESLSPKLCNESSVACIAHQVVESSRPDIMESELTSEIFPLILDNSTPPMTLFEQIASDPVIPSGWNKQTITYGDEVLLVYFINKCVKVGGKMKMLILKEVILKIDGSFQINVLGKPVESTDLKIVLDPIESPGKLRELLASLSSLSICTGSKLPDQLNRDIGSGIYQDPSGTWRHERCFLFWTTSVCPFCRKARKSTIAKSRRMAKQDVTKRIRLKVHSKDKKLLEKLRKKYRATKKAASRGINIIEKLKSTIDKCQKKISNSGECLNQYLKSTQLQENQKRVLQEIVASAKCNNSKGRRYSEEWIILCLLLHMRSPASYNFLRKNGILPLPHVRTVRRYLAKLDTSCGFDSRFFEVFKLSLAKKTEIQRHGILLLDEMATRESINVNTKTLSYKGLIDFGEDGMQSSNLTEKANHGLVIMFHPLADNYTQPIAVFASRGSVKGDVLAQLLIKAIALLEKVGAKVQGVVTDGASTNRKFWSEMGVSGQRTNLRNFFEHPTVEGRRVYVFSDTPHLIKTIRNRLFGQKILQMDPAHPPVKWNDIDILHTKDREFAGPGQALVCPKLTKCHVELNNTQKMRVRLAVQVFSNSVAKVLRFFKTYVPELANCEGTASFCEWMNNLFDALNRKNTKEE